MSGLSGFGDKGGQDLGQDLGIRGDQDLGIRGEGLGS